MADRSDFLKGARSSLFDDLGGGRLPVAAEVEEGEPACLAFGYLRGMHERALGLDEDVDLPGFDANPFKYLKHAAVYVMSSDWEGLPTALIEAMACGTPVVATDCDSGPREILLDGALGRIVPRGNADALAEAIVETLRDPGGSEQRVARAREFSLDRAVDRYLEVCGWA